MSEENKTHSGENDEIEELDELEELDEIRDLDEIDGSLNEEEPLDFDAEEIEAKIDAAMSDLTLDEEEDGEIDEIGQYEYDGDGDFDDEDDFADDESGDEEDSEEEYEEEYEDSEEDDEDDEDDEYEDDEDEEEEEDEEEDPPRPTSESIIRAIAQENHEQYSQSAQQAYLAQQRRSARPGENDHPAPPVKKSHKGLIKGLKITGIVAAMLAVTAGCTYGAISYYYSNRFFNGTILNGIDVSGKTAYEAEQLLSAKASDYSITVGSRNLADQSISGDSIGYQYVSDGEILALLKQQNPFEWITGFTKQRTYTVDQSTTFDKTLLQAQVLSLECAQEANQVVPEDAYVAYNGESFQIVPETEGAELNARGAYQILDDAIENGDSSINLGDFSDAYVPAEICSDNEDLAAAMNACNNYTNASITYTFGDQSVTLDGSTIKEWLQFDEKGQLVYDDASFQAHIAEFVSQLAAQYDTVGTTRTFTATDGRTVSVYGTAYGWQIDQAQEAAQLSSEIESGAQTVRDPIYSMTANSRGENDFGDTYIEVDLGNQHMYYYKNGSCIFDSDFVSGLATDPERVTPEGVYTLYYKKSPETLRGEQKEDGTYAYESEVTYWMPFNGGVGFHDATWRDEFGGTIYQYSGSHGCINLPYSSAAALYDIIEYNVPIIVFN